MGPKLSREVEMMGQLGSFIAGTQLAAEQVDRLGQDFIKSMSFSTKLWRPALDPVLRRRLHNFCVHHGRLTNLAKKQWSPCGTVVGCGATYDA